LFLEITEWRRKSLEGLHSSKNVNQTISNQFNCFYRIVPLWITAET